MTKNKSIDQNILLLFNYITPLFLMELLFIKLTLHKKNSFFNIFLKEKVWWGGRDLNPNQQVSSYLLDIIPFRVIAPKETPGACRSTRLNYHPNKKRKSNCAYKVFIKTNYIPERSLRKLLRGLQSQQIACLLKQKTILARMKQALSPKILWWIMHTP